MVIKEYNFLPDDAKLIRTEVFVEEQGFEIEFDDIDSKSTHLVMYNNQQPVATCRMYCDEDKTEWHIGRIAVRKSCRGQKLGAKILSAAEDTVKRLGGTTAMLSAQVRVKDFYEKQGYSAFGNIYLDEDCPHIMMKKCIE